MIRGDLEVAGDVSDWVRRGKEGTLMVDANPGFIPSLLSFP